MAISEQEAQIGTRIRLVRKESGFSQRLAARQMLLLNREQLKRIEGGASAVRFPDAFMFCYFTATSPLWLAFGEPEKRYGFFGVRPLAGVNDPRAGFLEVMRRNRERFRKASVSRVYDSRVDHLESQIVRSSFGEVLKTFPERRMGGRTKKDVGTSFDKRYLISKMTLPENWEELRLRLRAKTESRQAKLALTRRLGVSLAAISQWRSGASVPTAANAIQILRFVCEPAARRGSKAKRRTLTKNRRERRSPANTKLRITKGQSRK